MRILFLLIFGFVVFLLQSCISINYIVAKNNLNIMRAQDFFSDKATIKLVKAAEVGNYARMDEAIKEGANVNEVGEDGLVTPLMWTLLKFRRRGFEYLLKKGANPNYINGGGDSVVTFSVDLRSSYYLKRALQYGGDPDIKDGYDRPDPLHISVAGMIPMFSNLKYVKLLIKANADLNFQDGSGMTPMQEASIFNSYDIIYLLLEAGADPLIRDDSGFNILYDLEEKNINTEHPIYEWYKKVVRFLRERGIKVNVTL